MRVIPASVKAHARKIIVTMNAGRSMIQNRHTGAF